MKNVKAEWSQTKKKANDSFDVDDDFFDRKSKKLKTELLAASVVDEVDAKDKHDMDYSHSVHKKFQKASWQISTNLLLHFAVMLNCTNSWANTTKTLQKAKTTSRKIKNNTTVGLECREFPSSTGF